MPDTESGWALFEKSEEFNNAINLNENVRVNENFYIGKQWEGVESNGLPTPQINFLKRVVGFIVATITTDNVKVNATALSNTPNTDKLLEPVRIANEEFEALKERNNITSLIRQFARGAAVDGDSALYSWWDPDMETGQKAKGGIRTEVIENTRVRFGNPNDRRVQSQPWILITANKVVREAKLEAKRNGISTWDDIKSDDGNLAMDAAKRTGDKVTDILLLWKNEETGTVWGYEFTKDSTIREPWDTELEMYPLVWLNWDYVADSYHGQAMITGLIPNQIFVNKILAAAMLSFLRTAFPTILYDKTRIKEWVGGVGRAIGFNGGDMNGVARILDPATISPQISQFVEMVVQMSEESLGATKVALGDTRPDNTSAIIALQRAASTPTEITKQNLYECIEDLFRIYLEFMAKYYGKRLVDMETPEEIKRTYAFVGQSAPAEIAMEFDFAELKNHPMNIKLDAGASSYYSEIAALNTLDNLLMNNRISTVQYLERIPDGYIPARRALIAELRQQEMMSQGAMGALPMGGGMPSAAPEGGDMLDIQEKPEIPTGGGFADLQRKVLESGTTAGLV